MTKTVYDTTASLATRDADTTFITSLAGEFQSWSSAAERLFGYTADETRGRTLRDLLLPLDRGDEDERLRTRVIANGAAAFESVLRRKDGTLLQVDVRGRVVGDGGDDGERVLAFALRDATRLRVLRDARIVDTRFGDLLESVPDGIVLVNASGHIVYANAQLAQLFGHPHETLQGKPVDELLPERLRGNHLRPRADSGPRSRGAALRALRVFDPARDRIRYTLELAGLRRDRTEFPIELSLSALQIEGSVMVMSAIRDITARKRAEDEMRRKNAELEQANRAKDQFLATMSHELRTPLNAVIGFTGTLLMGLAGPLNDEQARQLRTVQSSGRHLLALINDLLDVARIESGRIDLPLADTSCAAVVDAVAATLRPLAEEKRLGLRIDRPDGPVTVRANERALNQILINLVNNAIKFTEEGEVVIVLREELAADRAGVAITVIDTGPGIRKEDQGRLFQAFSQIESGVRRRLEGTGLGLHLSQKLANLLGGRIVCDSEPGRGSRFTLELPANAAT